MQNKIFGIGLPKTGTSSLSSALNILGFKSVHLPKKYKSSIWRTGNYYWEGDWTALTNFGEWFFPQLDETYPNSKFILTVRDKGEWLKSIESHFEKKANTIAGRVEIFGTIKFNEKRFSYVYDLHQKTVKDYFQERKQDLLIIDFRKGEVWENLCDFLDVDIPDEPVPCENSTLDKDIKDLQKKLKELKEIKKKRIKESEAEQARCKEDREKI